MANLLINTTVGGNAVITTSNIGSYALTSIPTSFSNITVTSSFDTATNDIYASMRVIRNNSAATDGMYIGYGNSGSGITRIFGGGATTGALEKYATYTVEPGSFRAPIFYDSADTSYYLDPNGNSVLTTATFNVNASSIITLTSAGTNASMIKAGAGDELYIGGNNTWQMRFSGANVLMDNGGYLQNNESLRAPIFYDSNDTGYYLDPNGLSVLSHIRLNNNWANTTPNDGAINIRGQYPSMTFRNTVSNSMWLRHMDASGTIQHYYAADGVDSVNWGIKHSMFGNGNFYSLGTHTASQFNGSGAGLTGTASSLSVNYATGAGALGGYSLDTMKKYIWSRGENLLTNGTGLMGNNTNFSSFTFDGSQAYFSSGSFRYTGQYQAPNTDELMPVNPEKRYRLDFWARTTNGQGAYYAFLNFFDVDGNAIVAPFHMYYANTLTTLAQTLNPGDTVAYLTSVANWENGGTAGVSTHIRSFIFWNYSNSFGYLYPPQTYSRNWYSDAWNPGAINSGNNTITLRVPWSGPSIAAGTQVSNGSAGGTYKYIALGYTIVPTAWTNYVGIMDGVDYSGSNAGGKFPPGTASAKLGFLTDYNASGDTIFLANLFVGVDNDYPIYDKTIGNTKIEKSGAFYGTIFYDSNNTSYYLDPNSTSNLYTVNATNFSAANAFYLNGQSYYLNSYNGGIYTNARFETASNLFVGGNSYLGNASGDETHINDILRVGATDSGDAHFYFGEGSLAGSDYGSHWYWDSGYRFTWYTRNAGTDSTLFYYDTNSLSYITWGRSISMNNNSIDYTGQLHFNGGTRFQSVDTHYLKFRTDATDYGSIQVRDANETLRGYLGYFDANGFGLLNSSGSWGIRLNPGNGDTLLYSGGNWKLTTTSAGISVNGNVYTNQNFGDGLVGVYSSTRYQGVFAMSNDYKLLADGTGTGNLYGIAWTHTNVGGQSKSGLGHQALFMDNGNTQTAIGSGIWTNGLITSIGYGTSANWNTAFGWGNHASAGYITSSGSISGTAGSISGFNNPTTASTANTIVYRDASGDVAAREFVLTSSTVHTVTPSSIVGIYPTTNQVVKFSASAVQTFLGLGSLAYSSATIPTNNNQLTNGAGYITGISFASVSSKPTTISGYGITDALYQNRDTINVDTFNPTGLYRGSTSGWSNRPPIGNNAGALLQIDTHPSDYAAQLFFDSSADRLYLRNASGGSWGSWLTMWHSGNLTNLNQLSNGPGYLTSSALSSYVPTSGATLTEGNYFYFRSNRGSYLGVLDSPSLQAFSTGGNSAFMSFHRGGYYAVNFGLDADNVMRIGGWSAGANRWQLDMDGNNTVAGSFRAPIFYDSDNTAYYGNFAGTSVVNAIRFNNSSNNGTLSAPNDWGIRVTTDAGYINFGPANGSYAHIYTDRDTFYFNRDLLVNGNSVLTSSNYSSWAATATQGSQGATAYSWGNHASAGYQSASTAINTGNIGSQSVNYATTAGSAPNGGNINSNYDVAVGDGNGLRFWGGSDSYKISMGVGALYQYGPVTDYSIKAQMNDSSTARGFTWGRISYAPIAALNSTSGDMEVAGYYKSYGYRGNGNVGGTGTASWHPDGIYCGSTMWQYGSLYKNNTGIYGVSEVQFNAGLYLQTYNDRNLIVKGNSSSDAGIEGRNAAGNNVFQIYGNGSDYGFLNGTWAGWDIRKTKNSAMYMNNNDSYYLHTNSTSNFYALNIQGNAVVHAGNIGSQSVSYAATSGSAGSVTGLTLTSSANGINPNSVTQNQIGYNTSVSLFGQTDGGLYSSAYSSDWIHQIYGDFRTGQIAIRGKNAGSWQAWRTVLDSSNYTSYAPSLTGSGASGSWGISVTGSAGSVAWTNVSSRPTALSQFTNDLGNYGGWLTTGGKAADSELIDGIDSSRIVYGNGARGKSVNMTSSSANTLDSANASGFYYGNAVTGMPSSDWWNWLSVTGNDWATSDGYAYQMAGSFWSDDFKLRRLTSGTWAGWVSIIHSGNIGSQSVSYASTSGSATTAGSATIAQQLTKFGDIYGQDWNSYFITGKLIVSNALGHSGANRPSDSYDYGTALSYGETGGPLMQMYFPEDVANTGGAYRALAYRSGYNGSWSAWKTVVNQVGNTCTVAGSNGTGLQVHSNVGYNQNPLTYFLLRGQADSSWKTFKILLTGDAGGQDIEFRRIAENSTDARMFYVPRGLNQVIFDYTVVQPSDSRLKDNLTPITTPVDKIKSLRGVEFDWNSGEHVGTHDVGLIAQDVEAVLPEAVTTQEDGYKNLAYTKVIPLLVEAMKEQQTMIEALRAEIELLKNK